MNRQDIMRPARVLGDTRRADIRFNACGRVDISARVARMLDLSPGDVIDVATCGVPTEYYLYVALRAEEAVGRHEAAVFPTNRSGKHSRTYSRRLCRVMIGLAGTSGPVSFASGNVTELPAPFGKAVAIITKNNLYHHD